MNFLLEGNPYFVLLRAMVVDVLNGDSNAPLGERSKSFVDARRAVIKAVVMNLASKRGMGTAGLTSETVLMSLNVKRERWDAIMSVIAGEFHVATMELSIGNTHPYGFQPRYGAAPGAGPGFFGGPGTYGYGSERYYRQPDMRMPHTSFDMVMRIEELEHRVSTLEMSHVQAVRGGRAWGWDDRNVVEAMLGKLNVFLQEKNEEFKYMDVVFPHGGLGSVWGHLVTINTEDYPAIMRITLADVPERHLTAIRHAVATIMYLPPYDDGHSGDVYTVGVPGSDFKYEFRSIDELFNTSMIVAAKAREYICRLAQIILTSQ